MTKDERCLSMESFAYTVKTGTALRRGRQHRLHSTKVQDIIRQDSKSKKRINEKNSHQRRHDVMMFNPFFLSGLLSGFWQFLSSPFQKFVHNLEQCEAREATCKNRIPNGNHYIRLLNTYIRAQTTWTIGKIPFSKRLAPRRDSASRLRLEYKFDIISCWKKPIHSAYKTSRAWCWQLVIKTWLAVFVVASIRNIDMVVYGIR